MNCVSRIDRLLLALLMLVGLGQRAFALEAPAPAVLDVRHRTLLNTHCASCHGAEKQKGKFRIDDLPYTITTVEVAEHWQKVLNALNAGEMPPEDEKPLPGADKADLLDDLANTMVVARRNLGDQQGVITMRRLNRREYRNTLRELLGVEINVSELPTDTGSGGFDTVGSNLFMSANQLEQYQSLALEALHEAFERQAAIGVTKQLRFEAETITTEVAKFVADQIDARERARAWSAAVEAAAAKPENQEVVARLRKEAKNDGIFRRSWSKISGAPAPESFGFTTKENNADQANSALNAGWLEYHQYYLRQPALDKGAYLGSPTLHPSLIALGFMDLLVPFNWPVGEYVFRVRIAATADAEPARRFIEYGIHPRHGQVLSTHEVIGTMDQPQVIEIPFTMTRGTGDRENRVLFIREKGSWDSNEEGQRKRHEAVKRNGIGPEVALWVDWMEIERRPELDRPKPPGLATLGIPLDDKSPIPTPGELRSALLRFAREAFRGAEPEPGFIDRLVLRYDARRKAGDKPSMALRQTLSVVLSAPMFLYLAEPAADQGRRSLPGKELATRLSYFLWGSPPDARLRDLAEQGKLATPSVLAAEVERLLDDPRARDFVRPFVTQWLGLERLDFFEIDRPRFPRFDDSTKLAARNEVYETVEHLLRNNGSMCDLLKADYVVVNRVMAEYYGLTGVTGDAYRAVKLPTASPRGGLLGMAAIHVMGGNGEHTSPVERGAWVLRKLLNDPPPPAPANIPAITRLAGKALTTRERLLAHQEDPQCASCHRKIDPIGLGLENFDAAGQWRTEDSYRVNDATGKPNAKATKTWTIDAAGKLHQGPAFTDFNGLRDIIAGRSENFARGFSAALLEYALGRPVGFRDEPLLDELVRQGRSHDFAIRSFIHHLVASSEFHSK